MRIKNNKGFVTIDASIAVLVLLIIIPTITGMVFNVNKTQSVLGKKTEATSIAINTIEILRGIGVEGIESGAFDRVTLVEKLEEIYTNIDGDISITGTNDDKIVVDGITIERNSSTYLLSVEVEEYANTVEDENLDIEYGYVKIVNVIVKFKVGQEIKEVKLETTLY